MASPGLYGSFQKASRDGLRGKYFLLWVEGPADLNEYSLFLLPLFLGARFGAMLMFVGLMASSIRANRSRTCVLLYFSSWGSCF